MNTISVAIVLSLWGLPAIMLMLVTESETIKKLTALYYGVTFTYIAWAVTKMFLGY